MKFDKNNSIFNDSLQNLHSMFHQLYAPVWYEPQANASPLLLWTFTSQLLQSYSSPQVSYHPSSQHYTHLSSNSFQPHQQPSSYLSQHQMVPSICLTWSYRLQYQLPTPWSICCWGHQTGAQIWVFYPRRKITLLHHCLNKRRLVQCMNQEFTILMILIITVIIIIFYFENVAFFHAMLGSDVCP